jgi:hypothetical protein
MTSGYIGNMHLCNCIKKWFTQINLGGEFETNSSSAPHSMPSNLQTQEALHGNFLALMKIQDQNGWRGIYWF